MGTPPSHPSCQDADLPLPDWPSRVVHVTTCTRRVVIPRLPKRRWKPMRTSCLPRRRAKFLHHKLAERSTKLLLKPKPNSPKPRPEQRKWAKRRVLKSTVPLTSLTRRWKTRQPKQRAESAAGLAANRSKCSDCLGVGAGAISSVHCFQRVFPIEAALNLKQHSISCLVEI